MKPSTRGGPSLVASCFIALVAILFPLACNKPVPIRVAPAASCPPASCPACECPACECPACPSATSVPSGKVDEDTQGEENKASAIPAHLRPTESQCERACGRIMDVEIRRMEARMEKAKAGLKKALRKGLTEERDLLSAECVTRCLSEFTVTTTACIVKYKELADINQCIIKMTLE
jgi:hypothetical protein